MELLSAKTPTEREMNKNRFSRVGYRDFTSIHFVLLFTSMDLVLDRCEVQSYSVCRLNCKSRMQKNWNSSRLAIRQFTMQRSILKY